MRGKKDRILRRKGRKGGRVKKMSGMNISRKVQQVMGVLQEMIDDDLAVVVIQNGDPLTIEETEEMDEMDEKLATFGLTTPENALNASSGGKFRDLLGRFVCRIEWVLSGEYDFCYDVSRQLSATEIQFTIDVTCICDVEDGAEFDEDVRNVFFQELPNIIKLYKRVGWEVEFKEDEEVGPTGLHTGNLILTGKLPESPYRKLIEDSSDGEVEKDTLEQ